MKKRLVFVTLFCALFLPCGMLFAQNDAFFYENFERESDGVDVASIVSQASQSGLNFGGFSADEDGLNFGGFSADEDGLNFGDFGTDEDGLNFGDFEMESENAPVGSGVLLLSGFAVLRLRRQDKRRK